MPWVFFLSFWAFFCSLVWYIGIGFSSSSDKWSVVMLALVVFIDSKRDWDRWESRIIQVKLGTTVPHWLTHSPVVILMNWFDCLISHCCCTNVYNFGRYKQHEEIIFECMSVLSLSHTHTINCVFEVKILFSFDAKKAFSILLCINPKVLVRWIIFIWGNLIFAQNL